MSYAEGAGELGRPENPAEGDLYYDKYVLHKYVRFVEVDGHPRRVTHRWDGKSWVMYDPAPNQFVISTPEGMDSPVEVLELIMDQILRQEFGDVLSPQMSPRIARSLARRLGLDRPSTEALGATPMTARVDELEDVKLAVIELLEYAPGHGYDARFGDLAYVSDNIGYANSALEYFKLLNGVVDANGDHVPMQNRKPLPLLSEPVYYAVVGGKDEGRTFKSILRKLMHAAGVKGDDL